MILATVEPKPALKLTAADGSPQPLSKTGLIIRTECRIARFGPTTPTRAGRLADASVDPTDARNDVSCLTT